MATSAIADVYNGSVKQGLAGSLCGVPHAAARRSAAYLSDFAGLRGNALGKNRTIEYNEYNVDSGDRRSHLPFPQRENEDR